MSKDDLYYHGSKVVIILAVAYLIFELGRSWLW